MKFIPLLTLAMLSMVGANASVNIHSTDAGNAGNNYDTTLINLKLCKKWRLIELNGQAIADMAERPAKIPFIQFDAKRRVSGNSSCNQFFGTYELSPNDRISFSPMGMTRMACLHDTNIEADLMQVLSTVDSYVLRNDTLVFNRARMAPLARWVKEKSMPLKKKRKK
jgi:heat shock protein HslJ